MADDRPSNRPRDGPDRKWSMVCGVEGTFRGTFRCLSPYLRRVLPSISSSSKNGCATTSRRNFLTSTAASTRTGRVGAGEGERRMGCNPHANGGMLLRDLHMPDFRAYAVDVPSPGAAVAGDTHVLGRFLRDMIRLNDDQRNFQLFGPDETISNRLEKPFSRVTNRQWDAGLVKNDHQFLACEGDVMEVLSEHQCKGWPGGNTLPAAMGCSTAKRGVHPHLGFDVQPAREVAEDVVGSRVAAEHRLAELPAVLHGLAAGPQRLHAPDPGFIDHVINKKSEIVRVTAAGCQLSALRHGSLPAQPAPMLMWWLRASIRPLVADQWMPARRAIAEGIGIWQWASNDQTAGPDVVMACSGDVPTLRPAGGRFPSSASICRISRSRWSIIRPSC